MKLRQYNILKHPRSRPGEVEKFEGIVSTSYAAALLSIGAEDSMLKNKPSKICGIRIYQDAKDFLYLCNHQAI